MHDDRSNKRYSNTFSCALLGPTVHWFGQVRVELPPVLITWKSLNSTRPHWFAGCAAVGALKVYWSGIAPGPPQRPAVPPPPQICGAVQLPQVIVPPQP